MTGVMSDIIKVWPGTWGLDKICSARVDMPNGSRVHGIWVPELTGADDIMTITDMYTPPKPDLRRQGVATRLTKSLIRYATDVSPAITKVDASVSIPHSLRIMHRLFPDALTIYDGSEEPENIIPIAEALGRMASWGEIPEETSERTLSMTVVADLKGVDVAGWEMPVQG